MARRNRIPEDNGSFNQYIRNTTGALLSGNPTAWQRLKLSAAQKDKWLEFNNRWVEIFTEYTDPLQRTTVTTQLKNKLRKQFITFANPLLNLITAQPALTQADRNTFNLRSHKRPYRHRGVIKETVHAALKPIGGGMVRAKLLGVKETGRAQRHPLADVAEISYVVLPVGAAPPAYAEQCSQHYATRQAYFRFQPVGALPGKILYCFMRWQNLSTPANSGSWSEVMQTMLF